MRAENWWNVTDRGKRLTGEKPGLSAIFVHHKSRMKETELEPGPTR